ncbi:YciI family protein [Neoaquamicrobium sediminum]|uniref:YciI family protein n=1 Tax=Neoaquamicrobium sediminum TaxID=1849104 RepID=A0ABV3WNF6_9HYPH|nr:hypothetical protein [Mesorhizobium sp.]
MNYMLMLYADEVAGSNIPPEEMKGFMDQLHAYREALRKANAFVATAPLARTNTACTVHVDRGEMKVQDGPYAETREQLGGYYIIRAETMDEAIKWAARCPAATWGTIEVRQIINLGDE